jgi:hypothetical protein
MTTISGTGSSVGYTNAINTDRQAWLDEQAEVDATYNADEAKQFETMSRAQVRSSADPLMQFGRMKISDKDRSILGEVAKLNGWSRQATEGMYKMSMATDKNMNSMGDFLKQLTQVEPGYFNESGGTASGLTEADRRRLMGIPEDFEEPVIDPATALDATSGAGKASKSGVASSVEAMSKKLSPEEDNALSQASQLNGVDKQSAVAYYKMYLAQHKEPSMSDFLQLLAQNEPDSYGKDGVIKKNDDDDNRVIRVTV